VNQAFSSLHITLIIIFQVAEHIEIHRGSKAVKIPMDHILQSMPGKEILMVIPLEPEDPKSSHDLIVKGLQQVNDKTATVICRSVSELQVSQ
jgi:hypothetical protein